MSDIIISPHVICKLRAVRSYITENIKKFQPGAKISGLGLSKLHQVWTNEDILKHRKKKETYDPNNDPIKIHTGIEKREVLGENQTLASKGTEAALNAITNANLDIRDLKIDQIICATSTPDQKAPGVAATIKNNLEKEGLNKNHGFAYDLRAGCTGTIMALENARNAFQSGKAEKILVIGADAALSRLTDLKFPGASSVFGDGVAAILLEKTFPEANQFLASYLHTLGEGNENLTTTELYPFTDSSTHSFNMMERNEKAQAGSIWMEAKAVTEFAKKALKNSLEKACQAAGIAVDKIDLFVPHQSNWEKILVPVANELGIDKNKFVSILKDKGNTSAASIPMAIPKAYKKLKEMAQQNPDKTEFYIALVGYGAGLSQGAHIIKISRDNKMLQNAA